MKRLTMMDLTASDRKILRVQAIPERVRCEGLDPTLKMLGVQDSLPELTAEDLDCGILLETMPLIEANLPSPECYISCPDEPPIAEDSQSAPVEEEKE